MLLWISCGFFGISKTAFSIADHFVTMTIDLDFFTKGRIVLRVNMCASNFYFKLCEGISDEEMVEVSTVDEETGDEIFTDKSFIKKI